MIHSPWQRYVPRINRSHRHWLTDTGSLTRKLKNHSQHFAVELQGQYHAPVSLAEYQAIDIPLAQQVWQRDVLLLCDDVPVVYGHTVTPCERVSRDWPFFNGLGTQALGSALFNDPLIQRAHFEFTRLSPKDELYQQIARATLTHGINLPPHLWARRCVFHHQRRPHSRIMVSEVMLPALYKLKPNNNHKKNDA